MEQKGGLVEIKHRKLSTDGASNLIENEVKLNYNENDELEVTLSNVVQSEKLPLDSNKVTSSNIVQSQKLTVDGASGGKVCDSSVSEMIEIAEGGLEPVEKVSKNAPKMAKKSSENVTLSENSKKRPLSEYIDAPCPILSLYR